MNLFDRLTVIDWKKDCRYANIYFTFLEDQLVLNSNIQLVTFQRLSQILPCKSDCNFDRLLSVSSSFNTNQSQLAIFALNTLKLLNPEISCKGSLISKYVSPPQNASALINQISKYFCIQKLTKIEELSKIWFILRSDKFVKSNRF